MAVLNVNVRAFISHAESLKLHNLYFVTCVSPSALNLKHGLTGLAAWDGSRNVGSGSNMKEQFPEMKMAELENQQSFSLFFFCKVGIPPLSSKFINIKLYIFSATWLFIQQYIMDIIQWLHYIGWLYHNR